MLRKNGKNIFAQKTICAPFLAIEFQFCRASQAAERAARQMSLNETHYKRLKNVCSVSASRKKSKFVTAKTFTISFHERTAKILLML